MAALQLSDEGEPLYLKFSVIKSLASKSMEDGLQANVKNHSQTFCEGKHCYETLCAICDKNKMPCKPQKQANFYWLHIILSNIKASIYGTFHSIDFKHYAYRYLADLQYRFNRRFNLKKLFYGLISSCAKNLPAVDL